MKLLLKLSFFSVLLAFGCGDKPAPVQEQPAVNAQDFIVIPGEKFGLLTPNSCSRSAVLAAYGKDAKPDSVYLYEGIFGEGVVLFPNNSRNRVEIYWEDTTSQRPTSIRVYGDSTGTDWKTADGITIGTTMADVEKLNGKPFDFSGTGWDYGGFVSDWKGGKFDNSLMLRFESTEVEGDAGNVSGEGIFSSDNPAAKAAKPKVILMEFRFFANEKLPACIEQKVKEDTTEGKMVVQKMTVGGTDHYWLNSGAAAYDGVEYIFDANCKEVCQTGGFRMPKDCMKAYEGGKWEVVWEER